MVIKRSCTVRDGDIVISRDGTEADIGHVYFVGRLPERRQFRFDTYERAFVVAQALAAERPGTIWVNDGSEDWSPVTDSR